MDHQVVAMVFGSAGRVQELELVDGEGAVAVREVQLIPPPSS